MPLNPVALPRASSTLNPSDNGDDPALSTLE